MIQLIKKHMQCRQIYFSGTLTFLLPRSTHTYIGSLETRGNLTLLNFRTLKPENLTQN